MCSSTLQPHQLQVQPGLVSDSSPFCSLVSKEFVLNQLYTIKFFFNKSLFTVFYFYSETHTKFELQRSPKYLHLFLGILTEYCKGKKKKNQATIYSVCDQMKMKSIRQFEGIRMIKPRKLEILHLPRQPLRSKLNSHKLLYIKLNYYISICKCL